MRHLALLALVVTLAGCWRLGPNDGVEAPDEDGSADTDVDTDTDSDTDTDVDTDSGTAADTTLVELIPPVGLEHWSMGLGSGNVGYTMVADVDLEVVALEAWAIVLSPSVIRAKICDADGEVVQLGEPVTGAWEVVWHRSEISYQLQAGEVYTISFYTATPDVNVFWNVKTNIAHPFEVPGYFSDVMVVHEEPGELVTFDGCPEDEASVAVFMRLEVVE